MKKSVYSKRVLQSLALVSALSLSSLVLANPTNTADTVTDSQTATAEAVADNGGVAANENSAALGINDTDLSDNSNNSQNDSANTDVAVSDLLNGNDLSDNSDNSTNTTDVGNTDVAVSDLLNDNDLSDNSDNSTYSDSSTTIGNISVAVALSELSSSVSGNSFSAGGAPVYTGYNVVDNGSLSNSAGITQVSMNSGFEALTQQSVNVQSNLSLGQ